MTQERYDDGGFSGGNLERPALKRLMADIRAGLIDIVVVYKIDRLTRSLLDFSKIVEIFDSASASFVSVTQAFNTTTSAVTGRLRQAGGDLRRAQGDLRVGDAAVQHHHLDGSADTEHPAVVRTVRT